MSLHGYSEDEESPILRDFVDDTIARELSPSPRTELLSPTEANRSQLEVDRVRHSQRQRAPSDRFRQQREQMYANVPAGELMAMLIEREYECKRLRKGLTRAFERVEVEVGRTTQAERVTQQTLDKLREVNRVRVDAERTLAKTGEELRLWKFQFEHAQKEIARAQEVVVLVETQRDDAERAAAKTRTLARQLKEHKLVDDALEAGRKLGYKAGFRRAQQEVALRQGLDAAETLTVDDGEEDEAESFRRPDMDGISFLDADSIRPSRRVPQNPTASTSRPAPSMPTPSPAMAMPTPQLASPFTTEPARRQAPPTARSPSIQLSIYPIDIPSASVFNDAPPTRRPSLQVQTELPPAPIPKSPQRRPPPAVVEPLFINRRVSPVPPSRPNSMQQDPVPARMPSPQPFRQPSPSPRQQQQHHWSQLPPRQPSPQPLSASRPPDNYIPSVSPDGDIPLPPPHSLANPALSSAGRAPSPEVPRVSSWYNNRERDHEPRTASVSASERQQQQSWYQTARRPRSTAESISASAAGRSASGRSGNYNPHARHASLDSAAVQIAASAKAQRMAMGDLGAIREDGSVSVRSGRSGQGHGRSLSGQERVNGFAQGHGHGQGQARRSVSMRESAESLLPPPPPVEKDPRHQAQAQAQRQAQDESRYSNADFARGSTYYPRPRAMSGSSQRSGASTAQQWQNQNDVDLGARPSLRRVKEKRPISPSELGSPMSGFGSGFGGMTLQVQPASSTSSQAQVHVLPPQTQTDRYLSPNYHTQPLPVPTSKDKDKDKVPLGFMPQTITVPGEITMPVSFKGKGISSPSPMQQSQSQSQLPFPGRPPSNNGSNTNLAPSLSRQASNASMRSTTSRNSKYAAYDAKTYVDPAYYAADTGYDFGAAVPRAPSRQRSRANSGASSHLEYFGPPGPG
ncbi:hypothetical protein C8F01DRAFT_1122951 [Mycena amicta]|nr:hypothetical protein C8F01DRAFT_1122951 [Mycena amicta]